MEVYVACGYGCGLQVIDKSGSTTPETIGSVSIPTEAKDVSVLGNHAYVADGVAGLQVINITNPASPTIDGSIRTNDARVEAVAGNYVYFADSYYFKVIDVSDPASRLAPTD